MLRSPIFAVLTFALLMTAASPSRASSSISLDVRELDIYDTIRLISTQASMNVVVDSSVQHRPVTLHLENVTFTEALATLAQTNDLELVTIGKIVYLGESEAINRRYPSSSHSGAPTVVFRLKNAAVTDVAKSLSDTLPKGTVVEADPRTSSVLVRGSTVDVRRAREIVARLDEESIETNSVVPMHYIRASDALKALEATLVIERPDSAFASDQQNEIVLAGSGDFRDRASRIIENVDRPGQQVRYEVRVTELNPTESSNVGVLFGGVDVNGAPTPGSGSTVTTFVRNSLAINATINAMVANGDAQILARPSISSLNNVQASLLVGQQYPIVYFDARTGTQQVQFADVGVNLNVTPTIGIDGMITTDLETDYSQVTGTIANFPIISTRKAQSTLRVHDGETIVIAGLFSDVDSKTLTKIPLLGDIPLLGELFRNRERNHSKDEVVFLITPHLVLDGDPSNATTSIPTPPGS